MDTGQIEAESIKNPSGADTDTASVNIYPTTKRLLLTHNNFMPSGQRQREEKGRIISPGIIDFNQNAEDEDSEENPPLYDSNATVVTKKNFKDVNWLGVKSLQFDSLTLPLTSHMTVQFSGTLVNIHFTKIIFPCNLILILQCGVYLKNITFEKITISSKKCLRAYVKSILPAVTSLTFIGCRQSKSLTKAESFLLAFLTDWVIFRSLRRLNFFVHPNNNKSCSSLDPNGASVLYNFCLVNSATIKEVKLPYFENSTLNSIPSHENQLEVEMEIFQRINENKSVEEYRNRFLDFLDSATPQLEQGDKNANTGLKNLQFSILNFHLISPPFPKSKSSSIIFQILRYQNQLQFLSYCEVGGNEETLDVLAQALKSSSNTLTSLSITIPLSSSSTDQSKKAALDLDLTTLLSNLSNLQTLSILCHKKKRLVNPQGIPKCSLKLLKIIGAFGLKELEKLFSDLPNFQQLECFHYQNIFYYYNYNKTQEEEDSLATGKEITPKLVTELFTAPNLISILILDKFTDREAIQQALENIKGIDEVKVIPYQNSQIVQISCKKT